MKVGPLVEAEDGALLTLKGLFCFSLCILPSFRHMLFKTPAGVLYPWLSTQLPPCLSFLPPLTSGHTSMPTPAFTSPGAALAHLLELLARVQLGKARFPSSSLLYREPSTLPGTQCLTKICLKTDLQV